MYYIFNTYNSLSKYFIKTEIKCIDYCIRAQLLLCLTSQYSFEIELVILWNLRFLRVKNSYFVTMQNFGATEKFNIN